VDLVVCENVAKEVQTRHKKSKQNFAIRKDLG